MGGFEEKMVKIDDDVFWEKQRNVIWSKSFDHEIHPYIVWFCIDGWPKIFATDFSIFSNVFADKNKRGSRFFGRRWGKKMD